MKYGDAVKAVRQLSGRTQQEMADALGCSKQAVRMYETGEFQPSEPIQEKLMEIAGGEIDDFCSNTIVPLRGLIDHDKDLDDLLCRNIQEVASENGLGTINQDRLRKGLGSIVQDDDEDDEDGGDGGLILLGLGALALMAFLGKK